MKKSGILVVALALGAFTLGSTNALASVKTLERIAIEAKCGGKSTTDKTKDAKCGNKNTAEATCGDKKTIDGKCGEGKCGEKKSKKETKKAKKVKAPKA
ncbi:hypothetical protein [Chryseobacterium sp.]|uniref:hypothetical protein n=1 Tax=Chryseobacterium sp. TaxID=1871047 RepID=UPI0031E001CE